MLHTLGIAKTIFKIKGNHNTVVIQNHAVFNGCSISITGNNNKVLIGDHAKLKECKISIKGDNHVLNISNHVSLRQCELLFEDNDCSIQIGSYSRILSHGYISVAEPFSKIEIGEKCLFSINTHIRNTDSHSILDISSGKRINLGKNIKIGNHIWIGADTKILKGVNIKDNSIVGISSVVTKEVPENCLVAGIPAKVIKTNVRWCEERIH